MVDLDTNLELQEANTRLRERLARMVLHIHANIIIKAQNQRRPSSYR